MKNETEQNVKEKKSSKRKYVIAVVCFILLVIVTLAVSIYSWEPKPDPAFEVAVRKAAAKQINEQIFSQLNYDHIKINLNRESQVKTQLRDPNENDEDKLKKRLELMKEALEDYENRRRAYQKEYEKDPNDLTDEDFLKVKTLEPIKGEFYNIKFLEKFTNLESISINISYPQSAVPSWMKFMDKLGVFNIEEKCVIDLSPLRKLSKLNNLSINAPVNNIKAIYGLLDLKTLYITSDLLSDLKPIENLTNLQTLIISGAKITDVEPLKNLTNISRLYIRDTNVIDIEPIRNMNKIEILDLYQAQVSNLEPISNLTNLESLELIDTKVTDLSPLKNLPNLRYLDIRGTKVRDYEPLKSLPKLEQFWVSGLVFQTQEDIEEFHKILPKVTLRGLPHGGLPSASKKNK